MEVGYSIEFPQAKTGLHADLFKLFKAIQKGKLGGQVAEAALAKLQAYVAALPPGSDALLKELLDTFQIVGNLETCFVDKKADHFCICFVVTPSFQRGNKTLDEHAFLSTLLEFFHRCGVDSLRATAQFDEFPETLLGTIEKGKPLLRMIREDEDEPAEPEPKPKRKSAAEPAGQGIDELVDACVEGDMERVRQLVAAGVDCRKVGRARKWSGLAAAACNGRTEVAEYLLEEGSPVDEPDLNNKWLPLHWASFTGSHGVIRALLKYGAKVDELTPKSKAHQPYNETPLGMAIDSQKPEAVKALLEGDANPNKRTSEYLMTPLYVAFRNKEPERWYPETREIVEMLRAAGAREPSKDGETHRCHAKSGARQDQRDSRQIRGGGSGVP